MSLRSTTVSGLKWTSLITIIQAVIQLIQIAILTRILPREAFGLVAITLMVVNFTTIFMDLGLNAAILHRSNPTRQEYSSLYWLSIAVSVMVYIILLVLAPLVSGFYQEKELVRLIPVLGLNVILIAMGRQHHTVLQKEFKFETIARITFIATLGALVVAVTTAILGFGVYSLIFSTLTISLISNVWMMLHNLKSNPLMFHFRMKEITPYLKVGGYNMGSNVMDFFYRESDTLIIGKVMGTDALGLYSLVKQLVLKLYNVLSPVLLTVLNPVLSSVQSDTLRVKSLVLKAVSSIVAVTVPVYLLVVVFSYPLLYLLYGSDYTSGWLVLSALAVSYIIQSVFTPSGSLQIATGRTDVGFYWSILQALFTSIAIFLAASHGINAIALAIVLLSVLLVIPHWLLLYYRLAGISWSEYTQALLYPFKAVMDAKTRIRVYDWLSASAYEALRRRSFQKSKNVVVDDYRKIPIVINNRNRLTHLKLLIDALAKRGYHNIIILDNDSTWPPLLEYYRTLPYKVEYLGRNAGYNALEQISLYRTIRKGYFVYTDSDVVPVDECPDDFLMQFVELLQERDDVQKVGFSLKIDDLPDCFADRQKIIDWEKRYFEQPCGGRAYEALIDTTFALHRPYALISTVGGFRMLRTAAPLEARHMPWYADSSKMSDEDQYYIDHVEIGTQWSKGLTIKRLSILRRIRIILSYI